MKTDSIVAVTVRTPAGKIVHQSNPAVAPRYAATDSLDAQLGGVLVAVVPVFLHQLEQDLIDERRDAAALGEL